MVTQSWKTTEVVERAQILKREGLGLNSDSATNSLYDFG